MDTKLSREEVIAWAKRITSGEGVDRDSFLDRLSLGGVARSLWNDGAFTLGIEYGVLIGLIAVHNITKEELYGYQGS